VWPFNNKGGLSKVFQKSFLVIFDLDFFDLFIYIFFINKKEMT